MDVFVVMQYDYDATDYVGVYSTLEAAQRVVENGGQDDDWEYRLSVYRQPLDAERSAAEPIDLKPIPKGKR